MNCQVKKIDNSYCGLNLKLQKNFDSKSDIKIMKRRKNKFTFFLCRFPMSEWIYCFTFLELGSETGDM